MKHSASLVVFTALMSCSQSNSDSFVNRDDLQASCEALVSAETGVRADQVRARNTSFDSSGSVTTVEVQGAAAPWLCLADVTGVVQGVEFSQEG